MSQSKWQSILQNFRYKRSCTEMLNIIFEKKDYRHWNLYICKQDDTLRVISRNFDIINCILFRFLLLSFNQKIYFQRDRDMTIFPIKVTGKNALETRDLKLKSIAQWLAVQKIDLHMNRHYTAILADNSSTRIRKILKRMLMTEMMLRKLFFLVNYTNRPSTDII